MPENPNRLKLIFLFACYALPGFILTVIVWVLSVYTPWFRSLGQILLTFIILLPLLLLSGYLTFRFINKKYLTPLSVITTIIRSILSKTFKPLESDNILEDFKPVYIMLSQLQASLNQDQQTFSGLSQIQTAQNHLFEVSLTETTDPIIVLNMKFEIKYVNFSAEGFTGIKRANIIGKRIDQYIRLYDKNNAEIPASKYAPIRKNNPEVKIFSASEVKIISSINQQTFADVTVFQPPQGEAIDVSCVILMQDRTKEKQLEAMKLDFVSMAAHELRTPLTSIKGYISVFINENKDKLNPEQLMFITRINTSTQQLAGLVENLLSVARVERGAMTLHTQIIDWVSNVKQQVDTFLHRADERRIELKFIEPNEKMPTVKVDLVRINEVLNNLVSNALNYTEPQGKIEVWIEKKDDMIITHVKDTGKGLPKEALTQLFSKFFRVQGGPAEQASKGNGLGLYLSKAIIELHKGKIWAESEGIGRGSTFSFSLPEVKDNFDISILTKSL